MNNVSIMCIPNEFKIKRKTDIEIFINKCMQRDSEYYLKINNEFAIFIRKDKDDYVSILEKRGDLYDVFNPLLEMASTKNDVYRINVQDCIWKYRKYINARWFNGRD